MKKSKIVLLTAVIGLTSLICAGSVCAFADTTETTAGIDNAHLIVIGCADVQGEADECVISGSIEAIGNDMADAEKKSGEILAKAREIFKPYGEVCENHYGVYPMYESNGYTATRYLTFTTDKTDNMNEIREKLASAGVNRLDGVCYRMKDDSALKLRALQLAVENAKAKAAALGASGELVKVEEISCYPTFRDCGDGKYDNGVTYTASVRAVFATFPKKEHEQKLPENKNEPQEPAANR